MQVLYERCCGLDVHKKVIVACLMTPGPEGEPQKHLRTFGTMTKDLLELADWLVEAGCTHVAMESTGVYWKPVYNLLEGLMEVLVVNAHHLKAVPGRKTDVKDAQWIAELLQHGLVRGSFIPPRPQRELRELTRYRKALVRERASEVNRLQKVLEDANIKLASVASDITGVSARAMLQALVGGSQDPEGLAQLARGRLREKRGELVQALEGRVTAHHRFLLAEQLAHLDYLEEAIERVSKEIEGRLHPFEEELARLESIPGVGRGTAEVLLAEVGPRLERFPSTRHLASWAGLCPGNHESGGKRHTGRTRQGSPWLREALVEAARAAGRTRTYLGALYHRLAVQRRLVHRLEALGLTVSLQPVPAPA